MKHTYHIHGMSCNGCRSHVEGILAGVKGVANATVDLEKAEAVLESDKEIPLRTLQQAMKQDGGHYSIHGQGDCHHGVSKSEKKENGNGTFYCPMHCEGEKIYDESGDCPVCGMDLVEEVSAVGAVPQEYVCPMHSEIVRDDPGDCPICDMGLVPRQVDLSAGDKSYNKLFGKFKVAMAFTLPIFIIAMWGMIPNNPLHKLWGVRYWNWIQFALSLPVVFYAAWMFFERAYRSLRTWNLNMFTLIGIGSGVAWLFSVFAILVPDFFPSQFKTDDGTTVHVYFEAATVILTLVLFGQMLEARAHGRTNSAVRELLGLAPNKAIRIVDGKEETIAIDQISKGDLLRVKPGGKIPVDGVVLEGESVVDESMITGESVPIHKGRGDNVSSGTINGKGSFVLKAEKVGSDTLLSQIIDMVNKASRSQAPIQKLADKISGYFVPTVVFISVAIFIIWIFFGPEPAYVYALVNAIAVLIIACPCALGLATPMSVMVGVGKGARSGVLIKNAEVFERMVKIDTLIIDKTGTITEGKPSVEKVGSVAGLDPRKIGQYIVSLNQYSEHPLADAIVRYGKAKGIKPLKVSDFNAVPGKGIMGKIGDDSIALGNGTQMADGNISIPDALESDVVAYQKQGKTVSYLAIGEVAVGFVVIGDKIKDTGKKAIQELQRSGISVVMLTGDNYDTAKAVSDELHLTDFRAEMLPQDKLAVVERLQAEGKKVAVAGDGINDAPALAKSDVGIAMGTGTDVAIESASITLVKGDLHGIVKAHRLSNSIMRNIKQNLFFALVYNAIGIPVAAGALFPFFGILLSPMIAALAMSFSSVSVITNALRLRTVEID